MKGRRLDPLVIIGAALLGLMLVLTAFATRSGDQNHGRTASVYDEGPGGAATLRRLIEALGVSTTTLEGDRFAPRIDTARVLFMLSASEPVTAQDIAAMRSYLRDGGTVVVAHDFELFLAPLLEGFDIHLAQGASSSTTHLAGPLFAAPPSRWSWVRRLWNRLPCTRSFGCAARRKCMPPCSRGPTVRGSSSWRQPSPTTRRLSAHQTSASVSVSRSERPVASSKRSRRWRTVLG